LKKKRQKTIFPGTLEKGGFSAPFKLLEFFSVFCQPKLSNQVKIFGKVNQEKVQYIAFLDRKIGTLFGIFGIIFRKAPKKGRKYNVFVKLLN